jgi:hypothetical protein
VARSSKSGFPIPVTDRLESVSHSPLRDKSASGYQRGGGCIEVTPRRQPTADKSVMRKSDPLIVLAPGDPDHSALSSVITEWLVPLLVKEFLAEYWQSPERDSQDTTIGVHGEEDAAKVRIQAPCP